MNSNLLSQKSIQLAITFWIVIWVVTKSEAIQKNAVGQKKSQVVALVCEIYEKFEWITINNNKSLVQGGIPVEVNKRKETIDWLNGLNFNEFSSPMKDDFDRYRKAIIRSAEEPPSNPVALGSNLSEFMSLVTYLLVDYEIDQRKASQCGCTDYVAKKFDALLSVYQGAFFIIQQRLRTENLERLRPVAKLFVEYLVIWKAMFEAKSRPVYAQVSLLAMQPDTLEDKFEKLEFEKLHKALIEHSRYVTLKDESLEKNRYSPAVNFLIIMQNFKITEEEIKKAGREDLVILARGMSKIIK